MAGEFERYAVYWVPKHSDPLVKFGLSWTGWCSERGEHRHRSAFHGVCVDIPTLTRRTWRHGFHAVIKAPFHLHEGRSRFSLEHALEQSIDQSVAFRLPGLCLAVVGGRVALVPRRNSPALDDVVTRVGDAMARLDAAPPNGFAENPAPLPDAIAAAFNGEQTDSLVQLPTADAHRFHIPLTDQLGLEIAFEVMEQLRPLLEPMLHLPRRLRDVALMGDPGEGRPLRVLERYDLQGAPLPRASAAMPCQGPHVLAPMLNEPMAGTELVI